MRKKYIISLVVIGIMLFSLAIIGTGYGLWLATNNTKAKSSKTLNCFKVYLSNDGLIEMKNIDPIINEEGIETSPYTLTITNICEADKELQVRLNILEENTVDTKSLTINAAGNIVEETTLYDNLPTTKTTEENTKTSKLIGSIKVKPNETVRTNIRLWFDEKKGATIDSKEIFKAKFEIIDTESSIKSTFAEMLLNSKNDSNEKPNYTNISNTNEGLYEIKENDHLSYYFRGSVDNNYVLFANQIWRIVSINNDNSIKLILDKSVGYQQFSQYTNAPDYTGLKYIYNNVEINNNINSYLLQWYNTNIVNTNFDQYVKSTSFCNDASYTISNYHTYYNAYNRLVTNKNPSISCNSRSADYGGPYNQKVGLLTADEVVIAGGQYNTPNNNYYLYNGENFYTLSPAEYYNYQASVFYVSSNGALYTTKTTTQLGIRPVINLNENLTVSGKGTKDNPYTIDIQ